MAKPEGWTDADEQRVRAQAAEVRRRQDGDAAELNRRAGQGTLTDAERRRQVR